MKAMAAAALFLVLGAFAGALAAGCADQPRPANSAQIQAPTVSNGAAAKDGGGGGW